MLWLDTFSGIGMYALGLEQAGHEIIGFCENDKWAHKILKKHWPMKPISWCIKSLNEALKVSLEASPAKTSPWLGEAPDLPADVQDSSGSWCRPFAWLDQNTGLWKTWQQSLDGGWALFSEPWPPAGMMRNGIAYLREPLGHPTIAPAHTFLPTTAANEGKGSSRDRYRGSPNSRGSKMSDMLRTSPSDPAYTHPNFAEAVMGLPKDFTALETETPTASSENLQKD